MQAMNSASHGLRVIPMTEALSPTPRQDFAASLSLRHCGHCHFPRPSRLILIRCKPMLQNSDRQIKRRGSIYTFALPHDLILIQ